MSCLRSPGSIDMAATLHAEERDAIDLAMARPGSRIVLAESGHVRVHVCAGDLAGLPGRDRTIRTGSARRDDLLVWILVTGAPAAGVGDNSGVDDISLAPAHPRAAHDRGDGACLCDRAYHHLFRF